MSRDLAMTYCTGQGRVNTLVYVGVSFRCKKVGVTNVAQVGRDLVEESGVLGDPRVLRILAPLAPS